MMSVSFLVSKVHIDLIDDFVKDGLYPHRSEALRQAVRDFVHAEQQRRETANAGWEVEPRVG